MVSVSVCLSVFADSTTVLTTINQRQPNLSPTVRAYPETTLGVHTWWVPAMRSHRVVLIDMESSQLMLKAMQIDQEAKLGQYISVSNKCILQFLYKMYWCLIYGSFSSKLSCVDTSRYLHTFRMYMCSMGTCVSRTNMTSWNHCGIIAVSIQHTQKVSGSLFPSQRLFLYETWHVYLCSCLARPHCLFRRWCCVPLCLCTYMSSLL